MADRKITELSAMSAGGQATGDLVTIVDVSEAAAADKNKKMTMENLFKGIPGDVGIGTSSPSSYGGAVKLATVSASNTALSIASGTSSDGTLFFADGTSGDATYRGSVKYSHSSDAMLFATAASERMRITSNGTTLIGATTSVDVGSTAHGEFQIKTASNVGAAIYSTANAAGPAAILALGHARGSATGALQSGDVMGEVRFAGGDGTDLESLGASIKAEVDGTPGSNDMPGRLVFFTTADGASSPTERVRINSSGRVGVGTTSPQSRLHIDGAEDATGGIVLSAGAQNHQWFLSSDFVNVHNIATSSAAAAHTWQTNGSELVRIDASGRLLVGTSSALSGGNSQYAKIQTLGNTAGATGNARVVIGRGEAATSMSSGDSIGEVNFTDNTSAEFAQIQAFVDGTPGSNDYPGRLVFNTTADGASSPTERMRITSSGNVGIGYDSPTAKLEVKESTSSATTTIFRIKSNWQNSNQTQFLILSNGNAQNRNNSYTAISDAKLKENIVDANSQWEDLKNLRVRNYNFIASEGDPNSTHIGLVAQEVEPISPGLVLETPDEDESGNDLGTVTKSVNYSVLYMKAVKALQEAMDRIETLEAKVAALEAG